MKLLYAGLSAVAALALIAWLERDQLPHFQLVTTDGLRSAHSLSYCVIQALAGYVAHARRSGQ